MTPSDTAHSEGEKTLPDVLEGHWNTAEGRAMAERYAVMGRSEIGKPNLTDLELANAVFMANRNDLDLIVYQTAAKERIRWLSAHLALARSTPPSGPQGENLIGAAELAVGQFVYRRIEKLMGAEPGSPEAAELDYLASIASDVEEYGAAGDEDGQRSPFQDDHGPECLTPEEAWQDLIEKDDRTSPSDAPEMALINFDELRDYMLSVARPQGEEGLWRPISEAPRDGEHIFGICADAYTPTPFETWWSPSKEGWEHRSRPEEKYSGGLTQWFPTHWLPKSALPAVSNQGKPSS